ncbi:Scn11a, partial [Symbiodinium microadriaticum]
MKAEFALQKDVLNGFTQQMSAMVQEALQRPETPILTPTPLLPVRFPETAASSMTLPPAQPVSLSVPQSPRSPATPDSEDQKQKPNFFRFSTASNVGPVDTEHAGMATPGTADASRRNSMASRASSSHAFKPGAEKEGEDADMSEGVGPRQSKVTAKNLKKDRSTTISSLRSTFTTTPSDAADKATSSWDSIYLQGNFKEQRKKAEAAAKKLSTINSSENGVSLSPSRLSREIDEPKSFSEWLVMSTVFKVGMPLVIFVNLVLLGVEVDVSSPFPPGDDPRAFFIMNSVIVVIFVLEILLKLVAYGCRGFFFGSDKWWNLFDLFIVVLSVFETLAELLLSAVAQTQMDPSHLRIMRFLRLVRALRGIRVVRLLRYIGALRTIVFSIISTLGSVFWTSLLLVVLFYLFGVLIAQIVTDHCRHVKFQPDSLDCANEEVFGKLLTYWSSVPESMLTLLMAITGGLSWNDALTPLRPISEI